MAEWQIEPLADDHERGAFSCGKAPLDVFIQTQAGQYARKGVGRTFVAVRPGAKDVVGYYTLAASAIEFVHFPAGLGKRLPKHPVPVILLGRLAVDSAARGQGLGSGLLMDALQRALRIADELGSSGSTSTRSTTRRKRSTRDSASHRCSIRNGTWSCRWRQSARASILQRSERSGEGGIVHADLWLVSRRFHHGASFADFGFFGAGPCPPA